MTTNAERSDPKVLFSRDEGPRFSLVDEPWIPVRDQDGAVREVSLAELFLRAHEFKAIAESNPLTKFALLRAVTGLAYLIVDHGEGSIRRSGKARKVLKTAATNNAGFNHESIDAVLTQWSDRLWLFHPTHPFMQDPALAYDTSIKPGHAQGPRAITPFLPGKSSSRWGVNVGAAGALSLAQTCRHLAVHWFYTPAGNSARRTDPNNPTKKASRVLSPALPNFPTLTQFARRGASLYQTIVGNLVSELLPGDDDMAFPAWLAVPDLSLRSEIIHPLMASSLSCSTALIVETEPAQRVLTKNFLTGPVVFDKDYDKPHERLAVRAIAVDPHTIFDPNPKLKANHPRRKIVGTFTGLSPFCFELCGAEARAESIRHGVAAAKELVVSHTVVPNLDVLQITQGGTGSGRTLEQAELLTLFAASLSPNAWNSDEESSRLQAARIDAQLQPLFAKSKSVQSTLRYAIKLAVNGGPRDADARQRSATTFFLEAISERVQNFIAAHSSSNGPAPALPAQPVHEAATQAFERAAGDLRSSQRNAVAYWNANSYLNNALRKVLDDSEV